MPISSRVLFCLAFFLGIFCPKGLFAKLEDHLKKIIDKGEGHQIRNVDFIYLINLDKRPEKFASCLAQLRPYGIEPYRFSAVNGRNLSREALDDCGVRFKVGMRGDIPGMYCPLDDGSLVHELANVLGRAYFFDTMSLGTIGCSLSHLSILRDAYDAGYSTIWIMEDDINVIKNPHLVSACIDRLDQLVGHDGWDLLFTDQDMISDETGTYNSCFVCFIRPDFILKNPGRFFQRVVINDEFRRIGARYGTHSYLIRRSGMKKILDFVKRYNLFYPIDAEIFFPSASVSTNCCAM